MEDDRHPAAGSLAGVTAFSIAETRRAAGADLDRVRIRRRHAPAKGGPAN